MTHMTDSHNSLSEQIKGKRKGGQGNGNFGAWGVEQLGRHLAVKPTFEIYNFQMIYCAVKNQIANLKLQFTYQNSVEKSWSAYAK